MSLTETEDALDRARRWIDADPAHAPSLAELADQAGLSLFHFVRAFAARYGEGPATYIRARRLASAAETLQSRSAPPLVELAFDSGFESQEGFTRAFSRAFGLPPGRYRRIAQSERRTTMSEEIDRPAALTESAKPVRKPAFRIAGLLRDFEEHERAEIPQLWAALNAAWPALQASPRRTVGVCMAAPQLETCGLRYLAGAELLAGESPPDGLEIIELPARPYFVFRQVLGAGPLHEQMQAAVKVIWGERVPALGLSLAKAPDLEVYSEDFVPGRPGAWVEWWLPAAD